MVTDTPDEGARFTMRKTKSRAPSSVKAVKIQLRLRPDHKAVLARAAQLCQTSLSSFLLEHAYEAAQTGGAEQGDIIMPPAEWAAFCKAPDAPPREIPALKKLLREASVFDGPGNATAP